MKRLALYGSTGSIGVQALEVLAQFGDRYEIVLLAGYVNGDLLLEQARSIRPRYACLFSPEARAKYEGAFRDLQIPLIGREEAEELAASPDVDVVLNALVGAAGLPVTVNALRAQKRLLLANKESLVIAGEYLSTAFPAWREVTLPVDSEHSALFQCLLGENRQSVERIVVTASGGPFRDYTAEQLASVTPEEALAHPTWRMGKKITIDSATLMNKGLEVIEAHHLFAFPYERIQVVIHPTSIVHAMVVFRDGTVKAVMSKPDMKLPIQYALFYPAREEMVIEPLALHALTLEFSSPDMKRFPCLALAIEAGSKGGTFPIVLNAANEIAVAAFLAGVIGFSDIAAVVAEALSLTSWQPVQSLEDIYAADEGARVLARRIVEQRSRERRS